MIAYLVLLLAAPDVLFEDVNVVTMRDENVLSGHSVLVRNGRIAAVGRKVAAPKGARRVEGRGRYLMPGLADMHVHLWYEEECTLFLANGVTTVRNLWGRERHLRWARQIEAGKRFGPTLLTTGPILDGYPAIWERSISVRTVADAEKAVARLHRRGFGSIKVYNRLKPSVYDALVKACRARGMKVCGHVPYGVGIDRVLAAKQDSIEHLDGYFGSPWRDYKPELLKERARRTAAAGTWNCPTIVVYTRFVPAEEGRRLLKEPEMRFVPPRLRVTWRPDRDFRLKGMTENAFRRLRRHIEWERSMVKWLHDAGAPLLVGTDAGNPFVVPGWSMHLELAQFRKAGLSPYETLAAATREAGRFAGQPFGTVAVGQRADLLLVRGNPLEDVGHCRNPDAVMARGRYWTRAELDAKLEEVARSYDRPKERFAGLPALPELPAGQHYRWRMRWNGLEVGEERAAWNGRRLVVQRVNDAPWSYVRTTDLSCDEAGDVARARVHWRDDEIARERRYAAGEVDADGCFSSWMVVARRFASLKVGGEWSREYRRPSEELEEPSESFRLVVRRLADEDGRRCFLVRQHRAEKTYESRLWLRDGVPVRYRIELQLGTVEIELVQE